MAAAIFRTAWAPGAQRRSQIKGDQNFLIGDDCPYVNNRITEGRSVPAQILW
ncbi:MAG: hypothetical protein ABFS23_00105 [Pseudomonadota bacterium]